MAAKFIPLLLLAHPALTTQVTITRDIPSSGHECIRDCLHRPYAAGTDLGDALECAPPYEEDCYCPTAAPQATIVSRHIDDCASESCSRGDLTKDVESMQFYYAGYCIPIGFTADLVQSWYDSVEIETSATSEVETVATTTTVVSTTTEEEAGSSTTEASTSEETEEATTSTSSSGAAETGEDDGRNPDGLPDMDFEGDDAEDGASMSRGGLVMLGAVPVVALFQWM